MAGAGYVRLQGLLQALQCRIASPAMPESRDCPRFEAERMLRDPDSPLSVHEGYALMDRQGAVLHFGVELG